MRSELLQIRVSAELKDKLKAKGPMSAYVRRLIETDLGSKQPLEGGPDLRKSEVRKEVIDSLEDKNPRVLDAETGEKVPYDPRMAIQPATAQEVTALARRRWPHLPLAVAEKKVKAET